MLWRARNSKTKGKSNHLVEDGKWECVDNGNLKEKTHDNDTSSRLSNSGTKKGITKFLIYLNSPSPPKIMNSLSPINKIHHTETSLLSYHISSNPYISTKLLWRMIIDISIKYNVFFQATINYKLISVLTKYVSIPM